MTAQLSPTPVFKGWDNNGAPLAFGKLYSYIAGTSTPQATYTDSTQVTPNTNPVILNARGECALWLDPTKTYKLLLQDSTGNTIPGWPVDQIGSQSPALTQIAFYGVDSGGANAYAITLTGSIPFILTTGVIVRFIALNNNTGASTINVAGTGAQSVVNDQGTALTGGEISSLNVTQVQWTGTAWQLVAADVTPAYARTAAEIAASVTPTNYGYQPGDVRRYGADPTGAADSTSAFNSAVQLGWVRVPTGNYKVTNVAVGTNNCTIVGDGQENAVITCGATTSNIFTVTGQRFHLRDLKLVGTTLTYACNLTNAGEFRATDVTFDSMGAGCVVGTASTSLIGPQVIRCKFRNSAAGVTEVYLGGLWIDTLLEDCSGVTSLADRALLIYDNATLGWQYLTVRGGAYQGYQKQAIAATDENADSTNRVWSVIVDGARFTAVNWSGVKVKNCYGVKIINNTFDGCCITAEDAANGLYGDVLANCQGRILIDNNIFRNSGTDAINVPKQASTGYPSGEHASQVSITNNQIDTTNVTAQGFQCGDGVKVLGSWHSVNIALNQIRNCGRWCIDAVSTAANPGWDLSVYNNLMADNTGALGSYNITFYETARLDGNYSKNIGGTGSILQNINCLLIGSTEVYIDPHTATRALQITNTLDCRIYARIGNSAYTAWAPTTAYTVGQQVYNGTHVYQCTTAGTSAGAGGPTSTSPTFLQTDGTVVWCYVCEYNLMTNALRFTGTHSKVDVNCDLSGLPSSFFEALPATGATCSIRWRTITTTVDATVTATTNILLPDATAWLVKHKTVGRSAADRACYERTSLWYRAGAGATQQGANSDLTVIESNAAWDANVVAASTNIQHRVTGAAATTVTWTADHELLSY